MTTEARKRQVTTARLVKKKFSCAAFPMLGRVVKISKQRSVDRQATELGSMAGNIMRNE